MNLITITTENLEREHICCAISNNRDCQVAAKKAWLAERLRDGLMFVKGDVRGKCFIEYIPAEKAWSPIAAEGYMHVDCLWVSGQFKGKGYSNLLLQQCVEDSKQKGKLGLTILSANKKLPFLADPQYLRHKGFLLADEAEPCYRLYYLPFSADAPLPRFRDCVKEPRPEGQGFVLYYAHQCPYTAKYAPLAEALAQARGIPFRTVRFETAEQAQNAPAPVTSYSVFYNGKLVTHEILSEAKWEKLFDSLGL